jgi:hypothetical protein
MKGVHPLYQLKVVSGNDDVKIAPTRPQKWATHSALIVNYHAKTDLLFVCSGPPKTLASLCMGRKDSKPPKTLAKPYKYTF